MLREPVSGAVREPVSGWWRRAEGLGGGHLLFEPKKLRKAGLGSRSTAATWQRHRLRHPFAAAFNDQAIGTRMRVSQLSLRGSGPAVCLRAGPARRALQLGCTRARVRELWP